MSMSNGARWRASAEVGKRPTGEVTGMAPAAERLYRDMLLIRRFEERCQVLAQEGAIRGSIHLCIGQEAVCVGAAAAFRPGQGDCLVCTYRCHGHVLAWGADPGRALAELLGKEGGLCRGRGGSMHLTDVERGILPPNGIVGAGLPIATGAALAQRLDGRGAVTLCVFGEGATNQGAFHEALNLAAVWALPVVFLCENNGYSEMTPAQEMVRIGAYTSRAGSYGLPGVQADGMDPLSVFRVVEEAFARARTGGGPTLVEATTYRYCGHYQGDVASPYRTREEVERWRQRDPLPAAAAALPPGRATAVEQEVEAVLATAEQFARQSPEPDPSGLLEGQYA